MRTIAEVRTELLRSGTFAAEQVPFLLVEFKANDSPSREFRTMTSPAQSFVPPLNAALLDPEARLVSLDKTTRNPYLGFLFVGRAATNDVILRDASVSKSHAVFETDRSEGWCLKDNRSHNGTFVDRKRLKENERVQLAPGALIVFGSYPAYYLPADELARLLR